MDLDTPTQLLRLIVADAVWLPCLASHSSDSYQHIQDQAAIMKKVACVVVVSRYLALGNVYY